MSPLPRSLPIVEYSARTQLWRIHNSDRGPVWFGPAPGTPPRNRFDAPAGEYRVCYFGDSPEVAFAETTIRGQRMRTVTRERLEAQSATSITTVRGLRLAQLHGPGLVRLGIGAEVAHGNPYAECQALALEIWEHAAAVDGIQYRSRWDNDRLCVALFDRAHHALGAPDGGTRLSEPSFLTRVLKRFEIGIE